MTSPQKSAVMRSKNRSANLRNRTRFSVTSRAASIHELHVVGLITFVQLADQFCSVYTVMLPEASAERVMGVWPEAVIPGAQRPGFPI
jgi:hypothetical protein